MPWWWPFGRRETPKPPERSGGSGGFKAADTGRLYRSWGASRLSADEAIRRDLVKMRNRSRLQESSNPYLKRYLRLARNNIAGWNGIRFSLRARLPDGTLDGVTNQAVEAGFSLWGRKGCTVDGRLTWRGTQGLVAHATPRDGEILLRHVRNFPGNAFRYALQILEPDHLAEDLNREFPDGRLIRMGVELDAWRRPIAYWIRKRHPGENVRVHSGSYIERVPASDIVHPYRIERAEQTRGYPWAHAMMPLAHQYDAYAEAEVIAARAGASKMGVYYTETGAEMTDADTPSGERQIELEEEFVAGHMQELPEGVRAELLDPQHPTTAFESFSRQMLRGQASGVMVSYPTFANDPSGVSFSSLRHFAVDERDAWRVDQAWLIDDLCEPVYQAWLEMALLTGAIPALRDRDPVAEFERLRFAAVWKPRGWQWVDPKSESKSNREMVGMSAKSITEVVEETSGREFEEVLDERAEELQLAKDKGVPIDLALGGSAVAEPAPADDDETGMEKEN